jgi:hypothetical protein
MSASFQWSESNGAGQVVTDGISNVNFGNVDAPNIVPVTNPIAAGTNSFEKWIRGKFYGTFNSIANLRFWKSAGAYVTGEDIKAVEDATYATPVSTTSIVALLTVPVAEVSALIPTAPVSNPDYSGYITMQLQTTVSTPPGSVNQKTFTLKYDET